LWTSTQDGTCQEDRTPLRSDSFFCIQKQRLARPHGLRLLLGGLLRLNPLCNGCHRHRRVDHGRARGRTERVVKGAFHSGASRCAANRVRRQFQAGTPHIFCWGFTGTPVNISDLSGVCWLIRGAQNNSFKYCCFLFNSVYLQLIASV